MPYYIGVDVGGTKIAAALVDAQGRIISRTKTATPRRVKPKDIYASIIESIDEVAREAGAASTIKGIGLGVPGIVDTEKDHILAAPNINLTGFPLSAHLKSRYRISIAMTNDVNAGLLGEAWMGAAKGLKHVVGLFPGTGVGGAAIINGQLLLGFQGAATELGHIIIDVKGPLCHCGNHGCLEALASRWAMERDFRAAIKSGRRSVLTQLTDGKLTVIKSRVIKEALGKNDAVVKSVVTRAAEHLGKASISLNHTFNPQAIVFGGGVIKACGDFMLPIIQRVLTADPFFKKFNACRILPSKLGDDAVLLGAVRLVSRP